MMKVISNPLLSTLTLLLLTVSLLQAQVYDSPISGNTSSAIEEGEAHIAINPIDSSQMIMGFMELGNGLNFKIYTSSDAGSSWQTSNFQPTAQMQTDLSPFSLVGGGDIVFAYDVNGDVYCSWITLWCNVSVPNGLDTCLWKSTWGKSTDNGANFTLESGSNKHFAEGLVNLNGALSVYDTADGIADRQWMAVDHSNGPNRNRLYVGYINYPSDVQQTGLRIKTKDGTASSFSTDKIAYLGSGQFTNIAVDQNGVLHYSFVDFAQNTVNHVSSSDGGQTFSPAHLIYTAQNLFPNGGAAQVNDRENSAPSMAIDGSGNLHLVWNDFPTNESFPLAFYSFSTDGGNTWSAPLDLTTIFPNRVFMPVVSAFGNKISIAGNVLDSNKLSEYHLALSDDGGSNFAPSVVMSSATTNFAAVGTQPFVGDYSSSVRTHCNIYSLWTDCRSNDCKQYVAKYNQCANVGLIELTPIESSFQMQAMYPNPTKGNVLIPINSINANSLNLEIIDASGRVLKREELEVQKGENLFPLDLTHLKPGNYFIKLTDQTGVYYTRTLVKE